MVGCGGGGGKWGWGGGFGKSSLRRERSLQPPTGDIKERDRQRLGGRRKQRRGKSVRGKSRSKGEICSGEKKLIPACIEGATG